MTVMHVDFQAEEFLIDVLGAKNVKRRGDELIHSCLLPFGLHKNGDQNPSAALNVEKLAYHCFGCGGGSLLWATQEILGISHEDARRLLEQNLSPVNVTPDQFMAQLTKLWEKDETTYSMPEYSEVMLKPWQCHAKYLDERGISHDVQDEMRTGINFENMDEIGKHWVTQPRLVLPHFFHGKLRGWQLRKLDNRQIGPKYKNTPNFPREQSFYNFDNVDREIILVESPLSVLRMKTEGIHNVIASFGVSLTDTQIELLKRFDRITVFPDGDKPGYKALVGRSYKDPGLIKRLMSFVDLWVIDHGIIQRENRYVYTGKDAANYSGADIKALIDAATPAYLWKWGYDELQEVHDGIASGPKDITASQ